jgi:TonB family protein
MVCVAMLGLLATHSPAQEINRKIISNPTPAYPEMAKSMKLRGVVRVQVIIGTDGTIKETKAIGGHPMLVESVTETLKRWKYAAASTETVTVLEFDFHP